MTTLCHFGDGAAHVVAQIIKPKLIVGGVGDVTGIGLTLFRIGLARIHNARGHAEGGKDLAHPFAVAFGEVIVDRDNVNTVSGQRIQIGRKRRDEGFAFARLHLGDIALVQKISADQLHIEPAQSKCALGGLATVGEGFRQQVVQRLATDGAAAQLRSFRDNSRVVQCLELRFQFIDLVDDRADGFYLAVV